MFCCIFYIIKLVQYVHGFFTLCSQDSLISNFPFLPLVILLNCLVSTDHIQDWKRFFHLHIKKNKKKKEISLPRMFLILPCAELLIYLHPCLIFFTKSFVGQIQNFLFICSSIVSLLCLICKARLKQRSARLKNSF